MATPKSSGTNEDAQTEKGMQAHEILLSLAPIAKEIKLSRAERVQHVMFDRVFTEILRAHMTLPPGYIIVVVGCTGVGKTTLREVLETQLRNHFLALETPEDYVSLVAVDLKLEAEKGFVWRRFYLAQLRPLSEPLMNKKVDLTEELRKLPNSGIAMRALSLEDEDVSALRDAVEAQFADRKVQFVLVDELNLLGQAKSADDDDLKLQMEIFKSLAASVPGTRYICFGTIEALQLLGLSSQLERRVMVIAFFDYSSSTEDLQSFGNGYLGYLKRLLNGYDASVMAKIRTIRRVCAGLFGVAVDWTLASNVDALEEKRPLAWDDMQRHMLSASQTDHLTGDVARIRAFFRSPPDRILRQPEAAPQARGRASRSRGKPGKRLPRRDHQA